FRQAKEDLFTIQNSRKARLGGLEGLRDQAFFQRKIREEAELRAKLEAKSAKPGEGAAGAFDKIAQAQKVAARITKEYLYKERRYGLFSNLFEIARDLVRLAEESTKPNSDRLKEYRESALKSLELSLYSEAPIYPEFEEAKLAHSLAEWRKVLPGDPTIA